MNAKQRTLFASLLLLTGCGGSSTENEPQQPANHTETPAPADPLAAAIEAQESGSIADAVELYDAILESDPTNTTAAYNRAIADIDLGNLERAAASLTSLLEMEPADAEILTARGRAYFHLGDLASALTDFQAAIDSDPLGPAAYEARADAWVEAGEPEAAIVDYWNATRLNPDDPTLYSSRELVYIAQEQTAEANTEAALRELTQTVADAVDAGLADAHLRRGLAFLAVGEGELALADLIASRDLDPTPVETRLALAHARLLVGEDEAALQGYAEIADNADAPRDARVDALAARAAMYELVGAPDLAAADLTRVIDLGDQADSSEARLRLAWLLATSPMDELRDGARAVELAAQAYTAVADSVSMRWVALDTMAAAYAETGDFGGARSAAEQAISAAPAEARPEIQTRLDGYRSDRPYRERD